MELYIYADMLLAPRFQDAIIDALVQEMGRTIYFHYDAIDEVYRNTTGSSPLRAVFVQGMASLPTSPALRAVLGLLPAEFVADLVLRQAEISEGLGPGEQPWDEVTMNRCLYHVHT